MPQTEARYIYASYRTYDRAESALEDMFASGDVTEGERPKIERRKDHRSATIAWDITLPMG